jgi:hypothetical protein
MKKIREKKQNNWNSSGSVKLEFVEKSRSRNPAKTRPLFIFYDTIIKIHFHDFMRKSQIWSEKNELIGTNLDFMT